MTESRPFLSVTELSERIKAGLEALFPYPLRVKGEVSNFKIYPSGHAYFSLKDGKSILSCVMWGSQVQRLTAKGGTLPKDGDEVLADGRVTSFPGRGTYQLSVLDIAPYGKGDALLKLDELKKKLAAEGLFDESRKRPIPRFPISIGVIAGANSAGMKDIVHNVQTRWPIVNLVIIPSLVQGSEAPKDLLRALNEAKAKGVDTLIVGRGGGSSEDLNAFNDEAVVRAVASFPSPVISAVGHEVDVTLVDFAADLRVSTPTGAAVAATPDQYEIRQALDDALDRLNRSETALLAFLKTKLENYATRPFFSRPELIYEDKMKMIGDLGKRLDFAQSSRLARLSERIEGQRQRMEAVGPVSVLKRGYSLVSDEQGQILTSVAQVEPGKTIKTQMKDGIIVSTVERKE